MQKRRKQLSRDAAPLSWTIKVFDGTERMIARRVSKQIAVKFSADGRVSEKYNPGISRLQIRAMPSDKRLLRRLFGGFYAEANEGYSLLSVAARTGSTTLLGAVEQLAQALRP